MAKISIVKASTNVTVNVFIQDSSSTTGAGLTGLVFNTASLVCYYVRPLAAAAALTLATQTVTGAHSDGGFVEIDATNMPGWYRLDLSDAIVATGVDHVGVHLKGAANMAPLPLEIQLTTFDLNDASPLVTLASETHTGAVIPTVTTVGTTTTNTDMRGTDNAALASALTTAQADLDIITGASGVNLLTATQASIDAIEVDTSTTLQAELDAIQAAVITNAAGADIAADIIAMKAETALIVADTNELQVDWVNGGRLDLLIDAIKLVTDALPNGGALTNLDAAISTVATPAQVNTEVSDVLKTDTITEMAQQAPPATPTFEEALMYLYMVLRNKIDITSTTKEFHNDAGTVIWKKALTDDATTYSEAEGVTGP